MLLSIFMDMKTTCFVAAGRFKERLVKHIHISNVAQLNPYEAATPY